MGVSGGTLEFFNFEKFYFLKFLDPEKHVLAHKSPLFHDLQKNLTMYGNFRPLDIFWYLNQPGVPGIRVGNHQMKFENFNLDNFWPKNGSKWNQRVLFGGISSSLD